MFINSMKHFVFSLGSLLDFLKSDTGSRLLLPKLIDFSAQVSFTLSATFCSFAQLKIVKCQLCHYYCKAGKRNKKRKTHSLVGESRQVFGVGD